MTLLVASGTGSKEIVPMAVERACRYIELGIRTAPQKLGKGNGPINHFHSIDFSGIEGLGRKASTLRRRPFVMKLDDEVAKPSRV